MTITKGNFITQMEETVTIIRPMPSSYLRGLVSPLSNAPTFSIRMHAEVIEIVDEASRLMGMTRADFMRWCSKYVAQDILRQKKEYDIKVGQHASY